MRKIDELMSAGAAALGSNGGAGTALYGKTETSSGPRSDEEKEREK